MSIVTGSRLSLGPVFCSSCSALVPPDLRKEWNVKIRLDNRERLLYTAKVRRGVVQLVEQRSPKPCVQGSNPCAPAILIFTAKVVYDILIKKYGPVVQSVRTLACHARGRRFEPVPGRHLLL